MNKKLNVALLLSSFLLTVLLCYMALSKDSLDYQKPINSKLVFDKNLPDNFTEVSYQNMQNILGIGQNVLEHLQCQTGEPTAKIKAMEAHKLKHYLYQHSQDSLWCEQYAKILWHEFQEKQIESRYVAMTGQSGNHSFVECAFTNIIGETSWASLQPTSSILIPLYKTKEYAKVLNVFDMVYCCKNGIDISSQKYFNNKNCDTDSTFKDLKYFNDVDKIYIYRTFPSANIVYKSMQKLQLIPYRTLYTEHATNMGFYLKIFIVYYLFLGSVLLFIIRKLLWILKK